MPAEIEVRPATPDDLDEILAVLRASLGESPLLKRTPELFSWKHYDNPFGESIVLVAVKDDRIAGVRAFMRWELGSPDSVIYRCVRAVDTATHPDFARQGIFRTLTMSALDVAREAGIDLVFNTPNPKSAAGYMKMGWTDVGWIGGYIRPRFGRAARPEPDEIIGLADGTEGIPEFAGPVDFDRERLGLRTARSPDYQTWRFSSHPTARYGFVKTESGGAVVRVGTRKDRSELVISDLLPGSDGSTVRNVAHANRTRYMATWFSKGSPELGAALRGGMVKVPGLKALRLVAMPLTDIDIEVGHLGSWDLATSDLELL